MNQVEVEEKKYQFTEKGSKIAFQHKLKFRNNAMRSMWRLLRSASFMYFGVVRDFTAIFQLGKMFVVLHHFINEKPDERMIDHRSPLSWR
jgi:DNA sulfur modification protein DndC